MKSNILCVWGSRELNDRFGLRIFLFLSSLFTVPSAGKSKRPSKLTHYGGSILLLDFGAKILHIFYICKLKDVFS